MSAPPRKFNLPKPYYQDDFVKIYHGDCKELIKNFSEAITITDPPYNVGYHYKSYADSLSVTDYQNLLLLSCRIPSVVIHYPESLFEFAFSIGQAPKKMAAWVYNSNTPRQWRGIAWYGIEPDFSLDGQEYKNQTDKRIIRRKENGEKARLYDWWNIEQVKNIGKEKTSHPCQIPISLMIRILKITPCDLIVDPFCGSGTTLRAAKDLKRKAVGIEIDESYCELSAKRLTQEVLICE